MIIEVWPTEEQVKYANVLVENWVQTKEDFKGDKETERVGMIGELVMDDLTGNPWPPQGQADGGHDIQWRGNTWDAKTERRKFKFKRTWQHNVNGKQINNNTFGYIFLSYQYQEGYIEICGYITKEELLKHAKFYGPGEKVYRDNGTYFYPEGDFGVYVIDHQFTTEFNSVTDV